MGKRFNTQRVRIGAVLMAALIAAIFSISQPLLADTAGFGLRAVDLKEAGNTGPVSFVVYGGGFDKSALFELTDFEGDRFSPTHAVLINEWRYIVTFNLTGAAEGKATLNVVQGGLTAQLTEALTIKNGLTGKLSFELIAPSGLRAGETGMILVSYGNTGYADVKIPLLILRVNGAAYLSTEPSGNNMGEMSVILGLPDGPLCTALRPGESVTIPYYIKVDLAGDAVATLTAIDTDDASLAGHAFDYGALLPDPSDPSYVAAQAQVAQMQTDYGGNLKVFYEKEMARLGAMTAYATNFYESMKHINGRWQAEPEASPYPMRDLGKLNSGPNPSLDPAVPPTPVGDGVKETHVVIVGINLYDLGGDVNLKGAVNDSLMMYNFFKYQMRLPDDQITLLTDNAGQGVSTIDKAVFREAILTSGADGDDNLVVFFAGHGGFVDGPSDRSEDDGLQGSLCMSDLSFAPGEEANTQVTERELHNWITEKGAGQTYLILDACHSGEFADGGFGPPRTAVVASCTAAQISGEAIYGDVEKGAWGGVLTPHLVAQLTRGESIEDAINNSRLAWAKQGFDQKPAFMPDGADVDHPFGDLTPPYQSGHLTSLPYSLDYFAKIADKNDLTPEPSRSVLDGFILEIKTEHPDWEMGSDAFNSLLSQKIEAWKIANGQSGTTRGGSMQVASGSPNPTNYLPGGLAVSQERRLFYVTDNDHGRLLMINPFERLHRRIALMEGLSHPADIDIGDKGRSAVYVNNGAVQRTFFGLTAYITDTEGHPLSGARTFLDTDLGTFNGIVDPDGYMTVMDLLKPALFSRSLFLTIYHNGGSQLYPITLQPTDQTFVKLTYSGAPGTIIPPVYGLGTLVPPEGPSFVPGPGDGEMENPLPVPAQVTPGQTTLIPDIPVDIPPDGSGVTGSPASPGTPSPGAGAASMPRIVILSPADDLKTVHTGHTLVGTVSDTSITSVILDIDGATESLPVSNKTFRQAITLSQGVNTILVRGTNDKGVTAQSDPVLVTVSPDFDGATGSLSGRLIDGYGYPAQGIRVVEESSGKVTYTDIDGHYRFTGVPVGRATIRVTL